MQPAGMGARAGAVIIDGLIVFIGLGVLIGVISGQAHSGDGSVGFNLHGLPAIIWFVLAYGYWIVCERLWGVTIGKLICSIQVQTADGGRPSWGQSAARNILRLVDGFPYVLPYLVGFIVAKTDSDRRRIGDRAAGTRVTAK
jgi:uncharacterized RDD family membrane protein YckC